MRKEGNFRNSDLLYKIKKGYYTIPNIATVIVSKTMIRYRTRHEWIRIKVNPGYVIRFMIRKHAQSTLILYKTRWEISCLTIKIVRRSTVKSTNTTDLRILKLCPTPIYETFKLYIAHT